MQGLAGELVDPAFERDRVELARGVLTPGRNRGDAKRLLPVVLQLAVHRAQAPDPVAAVVAVEVPAASGGHGPAAVDVAAGNRAAEVVAVDDDREDQPPARVRPLVARVARAPFPDAPAVVVERSLLGGRPHVDFLPVVLPDVGDVEVARGPVPREAPRVAQTVAGDLPLR